MAGVADYRIEGSYYEACNCEAICPCRRKNGVSKKHSTYGICEFLLSWQIEKGNAGGIDLSGLSVSMAGHYNDNEEDTPWRVVIYIDERAGNDQFEALGEIFRGNAKGNISFTVMISEVFGIKRANIELDHTAGKETIRIGNIASAEVVNVVEFDGIVTCAISGHDHPGQESISSISCADDRLQWAYKERCGFATDFTYWS